MAESPDNEPRETSPDVETEVPDLRGMTLSEVAAMDESSISHALRRVLARDEDPSDPVVAFLSSI